VPFASWPSASWKSRAVVAPAHPGLTLVEIADSDQCCGSAGIYNLVEPESARQIGERKVANVLDASPELLVSANPGCTLQIQSILRDRGLSLRAAHPMKCSMLQSAAVLSLDIPLSPRFMHGFFRRR